MGHLARMQTLPTYLPTYLYVVAKTVCKSSANDEIFGKLRAIRHCFNFVQHVAGTKFCFHNGTFQQKRASVSHEQNCWCNMFPGMCHSQSHLANHNKPKQHSRPIRTRNENGQPAKSAEKRYASDWLKRILRLWLVGIILYLHCQQSKTTQTQRYASLEAQGQLSCTSEVKWKRRRKIGNKK